ncbi:MAG: hypothetical protein JW894_14585 [Bacteroidales bacterium]|nr:hypothetical protein [Bacteroidales bacterium]
MEISFSFTSKFKIPVFILILTGMATIGYSIFVLHDHGERFWANFLLNNVFAIVISLCGLVFIAIHNLGNSGWQVAIQRIPEAVSMYLPFGSILMFIIVISMCFDANHLYHWVHPEGDVILEMKKGYLNVPFFSIRTLIYLAGWTFMAIWLRKVSLKNDRDNDIKYYRKSITISAIFIVFFAITSSMAAWDWIMSLEPHWFSTLFGWYVFSGLLVSGVAVITLITVLLKKTGYMPQVSKEHLHDLGKYLFAFSILWAYLWFSQYMLIWYGNIPEETVYFIERLKGFNTLFFINLFINFGFPFLALMTRNSKRVPIILALVSIVVLIGHWLDFYLLVMPGTLGENAQIGFVEIGMTLGFMGFFLFIVFTALSHANLIPVNHPYLKESLEYHTQY